MKIMFISDIHGSAKHLEVALERYKIEKVEKLIILGDILYHGPRNPILDTYDPKKVAKLLNEFEDEILSVRGNCDAEVDQMMLNFDVLIGNRRIQINETNFFLSHGHLYNNKVPRYLKEETIYVQGHTHIPMIKKENGVYHINPGSITLPKEDNPATYGIFENKEFVIRTMDGREFLKK